MDYSTVTLRYFMQSLHCIICFVRQKEIDAHNLQFWLLLGVELKVDNVEKIMFYISFVLEINYTNVVSLLGKHWIRPRLYPSMVIKFQVNFVESERHNIFVDIFILNWQSLSINFLLCWCFVCISCGKGRRECVM